MCKHRSSPARARVLSCLVAPSSLHDSFASPVCGLNPDVTLAYLPTHLFPQPHPSLQRYQTHTQSTHRSLAQSLTFTHSLIGDTRLSQDDTTDDHIKHAVPYWVYCSKDCQQKDFHRHKICCRTPEAAESIKDEGLWKNLFSVNKQSQLNDLAANNTCETPLEQYLDLLVAKLAGLENTLHFRVRDFFGRDIPG